MLMDRSTSASILQVSRVGSRTFKTSGERKGAVVPLPLLVMGESSKRPPSIISEALPYLKISWWGGLTSGLQTVAQNERLILNKVEDWSQL